MQGNWVDFWLLMVGSQTVNLTSGPSFDHTLCFKCPNGSCKPISNIYVPRAFQWYKKVFNLLSFDPVIVLWRFWSPPGLQTPKVEAPLGVWGFIPPHFPSIPGLLLACNLASPCLGHEPKARVATYWFFIRYNCWMYLWICKIIIALVYQ
jgi:hypothetical protein